MVSRSPRLSWLVRQMREEIVDLAEVKFAQKIQEGDVKCILHALSSPIARVRGFAAPKGTEVTIDAAPRHTTLQLEILPPTGRSFDYATGQIIEHEPLRVDNGPQFADAGAEGDDESIIEHDQLKDTRTEADL